MSVVGRKRRVSAEAEQRVRQWKPLKQFAAEHGWIPLDKFAEQIGVSAAAARMIRDGYRFKNQAPESR